MYFNGTKVDDKSKDKGKDKNTYNDKEQNKDEKSLDYSEFFGEDYPEEKDGVKYRVRCSLIGSMKGYWRKAENNFIQNDEKGKP